jgi:hypothetical protein
MVVAAIYYATPLEDGDLWWQMAYGKFMVEHGTLIPDHTLYSWTPTKADHIYCAWVSEIFLYLAYTVGGLPLLFTIRYLAVAAFLIVCLLFARHLRVHRHPLTWLVILLGLLMLRLGTFLKPEMVSLVFVLASTALWFWIKVRPQNVKLCYLFPVIMLTWVNAHGAVIFGMVLYFLIGVGELANALLYRESALPGRTLRHVLIALALSALAVLVTPYGIDYPVHLYNSHTAWDETYRNIGAYQSVLSEAGRVLHFHEYFLVGAAVLVVLVLLSRSFDPAVLLVSLCFGLLYTTFLRTTFFFAPVLALGAIYLLARAPRLRSAQAPRLRSGQSPGLNGLSRRSGWLVLGLSLLLMFFLGGRAGLERLSAPTTESWLSFDYSCYDPVIETEFVERFLPPQGIGNIYSLGGYLLWSFDRGHKVMVDPRFFPYKSWIKDYFQFEQGNLFNAFLDGYRCDVFIVDHTLEKLIGNFLSSPDWRVGFFGPTAVIFLRNDVTLPQEADTFAEDRFEQLKSPITAFDLLTFVMKIGDYASAETILAAMERDFRFVPFRTRVTEYRRYHAAMLDYRRGEFDKAIRGLEACRAGNVIWSNHVLTKLHNLKTVALMKEGREDAALGHALRALAVSPDDHHALLNAGAIGWWIERKNGARREARDPVGGKKRVVAWRGHLKKFLRLYGNASRAPASEIEMAEGILGGSYRGALIISTPEMGKKQ